MSEITKLYNNENLIIENMNFKMHFNLKNYIILRTKSTLLLTVGKKINNKIY